MNESLYFLQMTVGRSYACIHKLFTKTKVYLHMEYLNREEGKHMYLECAFKVKEHGIHIFTKHYNHLNAISSMCSLTCISPPQKRDSISSTDNNSICT